MPLYSLDIQKELRGEYWTNRYILDGASLLSLVAPADLILDAERAITIPDVDFTSYRLSTTVSGDDSYIIVPVGLPGQRVLASQALPLFCVVRVDFPPPQGRPSRKYLRGVLGESDQENYGDLLSSTVTFLADNYGVPVGAVPEYVDVDGQALGTGVIWPNVAMRQLRRGSRRRTMPII